MANNQYINKVEFGNNVLIDLSSDTVTASTILSGYTAHAANGATITGNIAIKTSHDITLVNNTLTIPAGYYSNMTKTINGVTLTAPSSGTNSFSVTLPNGANDTVTLVFTVDSNGNSDVTTDIIDATGVTF